MHAGVEIGWPLVAYKRRISTAALVSTPWSLLLTKSGTSLSYDRRTWSNTGYRSRTGFIVATDETLHDK